MTVAQLAEALAKLPPDDLVYVADQLGVSTTYAPVLSVGQRELADMRDRRFTGAVLTTSDGLSTRMEGLVLDAKDGHDAP